MSEKQFLTYSQAAELLGLSKDTVYRRVKTGDLPTFEVLGIKRIRRSDVQKLLEPKPPAAESL